jgi:hypothetical protein
MESSAAAHSHLAWEVTSMPLTLTLPIDLEQRLQMESQRQGIAVDQVTLQLLDQHLPPKDRAAAVGLLLQSWLDEENGEEQKETGDYLIRALDEDRLSERRLFPPDLEGVSW